MNQEVASLSKLHEGLPDREVFSQLKVKPPFHDFELVRVALPQQRFDFLFDDLLFGGLQIF
jgi:hypothetical protein